MLNMLSGACQTVKGLVQGFPNCGTRTTSGMRRYSRWIAK